MNLNGEAQVVVTSENTELTLGSIKGTSTSGRVRRMAADFNADGTIKKDNLRLRVEDWKATQSSNGPYMLGTCVFNLPYNAGSYGIASIIHVIAIEKKDDGTVFIDETALRKALQIIMNHCKNKKYRSVFIPLFGTGSGNLPAREVARKTITPLVSIIKSGNYKLDIYLGTYRTSAALFAANEIIDLNR